MRRLLILVGVLALAGCFERDYEVHAPYCRYSEKITFQYESEIDALMNSTAEKILKHNNNVCRLCGEC